MGKGPRNYTELTKKRLFSLSGNQCAFDGCSVMFTNSENDTNFSNICHIEGANPGSERYNPSMTDEERAHYNNLILLCPTHHIETNNVSVYTVDVLKKMKKDHETNVRKKIQTSTILNKYPSSLATIINHISAINLEDIAAEITTLSYSPKDKINYNEVISHKPLLKEYKVYHGKLNKIYQEIEKQGSFKKEILLQNINKLYLKAKGSILNGNNSIDNIRSHSDELISEVENLLWDLFEKSPNAKNDIPFEAINIGMQIIIVDAFVRCKILEEPTK